VFRFYRGRSRHAETKLLHTGKLWMGSPTLGESTGLERVFLHGIPFHAEGGTKAGQRRRLARLGVEEGKATLVFRFWAEDFYRDGGIRILEY